MKIIKEAKWVRGGFNLVAALMVSAAPVSAVWINELHYDNSGSDVGEFVEIAGVAGTDLSGWSVVLYNGGDGTAYATFNLAGIIDDEAGGFGALSFTRSGIQNDKEGLALVNPSSVAVQFLSYEGAFAATSGAAAGLSVDIGVSEQPAPAAGNSLQLTGSYGSFSWTGPAAASPGSLNADQVFRQPIDPNPGPTNGVPDAGASLGMFGCSIAGLCLVARRRRTAHTSRAAG